MAFEVKEKKQLTFYWIQSGILEVYGSFMVQEKNTKLRRLQSFFNAFIYQFAMIPLGYTIWISYPDITVMCSLMGIFIGFLSSTFKLPTLHFRIQHFIGIRTRILKLYERVLPGEEDYMEKIVKFVQKLALVNGFMLVVGSALLLTVPLIYAFVQDKLGNEDVVWPTPYHSEFFVDMNSTLNYSIVNIYCLYTLLLCVIMNNCIDCIFFESCMIAAAHFRILQKRFRDLKCTQPDFTGKLVDIISYQREIYDLAKEIQRAYCTILCPFFIIASIMSCAEFYTATLVRGIRPNCSDKIVQ